MNNNSNNEEKELQSQLQNHQFQQLNNNPRVVEIPVQHYTSPIITPNTNNLDSNNPDIDFFNRPRLFEDFNSPFDLIDSPLRNRSLFNREPLSSRFDDFFTGRPSLVHQQPPKQSIFEDPYLNRNGISPSRDTFQPTLLKERSNSTTQQPTLSGLNNYNNERHSPITSNQRTESPKLGANIFQIPIQHIQTAPVNSSEIPPYINSDFKHQIPVKRSTESPSRQTTPPSFKQPEQPPLLQQQQQQRIPSQPIIQPQQPSKPVVQSQQQQQPPPKAPPTPTPSQQPPKLVVPSQQQQQPPPPKAPPTPTPLQQPAPQSAPKPSAAHTSTAFINLDSDFKQPINISTSSNKFRAESPIRQQQIPSSTAKPVNKPQPINTPTQIEFSDFKQPQIPPQQQQQQQANPLNKIRSESPARQPTVIPLPPPPSVTSKLNTEAQQPIPVPQVTKTMGNSNGQNSKKGNHAANNVHTDATDSVNQQQSTFYVPTPTPASSTPAPAPKTSQDKCDEIACELENLHQAINQFTGNGKKDKNYLNLDELLTRCFLKLDNIDRTDEKVHQTRRKLIHFTQQLVDKLEAKVASPITEEASQTLNIETTPTAAAAEASEANTEKRSNTPENDNSKPKENQTNESSETNNNANNNSESTTPQLAEKPDQVESELTIKEEAEAPAAVITTETSVELSQN